MTTIDNDESHLLDVWVTDTLRVCALCVYVTRAPAQSIESICATEQSRVPSKKHLEDPSFCGGRKRDIDILM